jgi:hypothetical protein
MSTDRLLSIVSLAIGLASFFAAYIFYKKSLRLKLPMYEVYTNILVQDGVSQMSGLDILYKSRRVPVLSVSKVVFWNAGSDTLENSDIVKANPIRICCAGDIQLLDAEVLSANNKSSQFLIELAHSENEALIKFDYLDKDQGGVIQVVHTGLRSSDLAVIGDIKGAKLKKIRTTDFTEPLRKLLDATYIFLGLSMSFGGIYILLPAESLILFRGVFVPIVAGLFGCYSVLFFNALWALYSKVPRDLKMST